MWAHEVERLGLKRCSGAAYVLLTLSDYATLLAFALALADWVYFDWTWLWPVWLCWLAGRLLMIAAYRLLIRRHFRYDAAAITASWHDKNGRPQQYTEMDFLHERRADS